jgi:outer membrane scaffolding protein for murein synthesis (MipA/OmpV family)
MRPQVDLMRAFPASKTARPSSANPLRQLAFLCGCLLLLVMIPVRPAAAQTPSPLANWQYSSGVVLAPLGGPIPEWRITLGPSVTVMPKFEGANSYHVLPGGVVDIRYRDIAFLSTGEGLGVNILRGETYRAGVAMSVDLGRNDNDDGHLRGLGDIDPAPEAKVFGQVFVLPFVLTADVRRGIGGHDGWIADFGAYIPCCGSRKFVLFAGPSVTFADKNYMQSYFGVDAAQSANSRAGLQPFNAQSGLKNVNFGITALYFLTDHWLVIADGAFEQLVGDAAHSPITQDDSQFTFDLSIAYQF